MTKQEELQYLIGILTEASKWTPSPDDQRDLVRMEVEERINNLVMGIEPEPDENGLIQSTIHPDNPVDEQLTGDDYQALEATKLNNHLSGKDNAKRKWSSNRVRVVIDGKHTWKPRSECHKEVMTGWKSKQHWVWDGYEEPDVDKKKQVDAMWEEHDRA